MEGNALLVSMLVCSQDETARLKDETAWLQGESAQQMALAGLRDPIHRFHITIAHKMGYRAWSHLSDDLSMESNSQEPVHTALKDALQKKGLSMATWEGLRPIAIASNGPLCLNNALREEAVLEKVNHGLLPSELSSSQSALTNVLNYVHKCGYYSCSWCSKTQA